MRNYTGEVGSIPLHMKWPLWANHPERPFHIGYHSDRQKTVDWLEHYQPNMPVHMPTKSGSVLRVVSTLRTVTPSMRRPSIAANVAMRWSA